jgi:ferredoxin
VKIVIDADLCVGNGRCYTLAPDLVTDDERGYGQVTGDGTVPDARLEEARRLVVACPEGAISVVDD